ncbi:2-oxoacid:acceptor oxidoreductase family protein [Herbivorax sp. ANBcel31]|uniref:2-oxoacid:acceptor oxidoreductase family protein n=1 Tax=Herbivorax sp. ANBcel31 TaxID=3069754 RepID=UPI0027AE123E|nr:2-oxoacid:acceptor oxidoreductase family protein [Herbivorax sp. ANBcel31]MDQ2085811.1 2-oxoacid:acceptor oxidoreductase family protein [Herbivorax sp. ANBcel31]
MNKTTKIRMSGLGGQGVVTAAHILGVAATRDGKNSTVNPFFGAEKRLAPAESYVRISADEVYERGEILDPNIIMIFHPHVITMGKCYTMPFFEGLMPEGTLIINSDTELNLSDDEIKMLKNLNSRIIYVPATKISIDIGGTELSTNMSMLGALLKVTGIVSNKALEAALIDRFGGGKFVASGTTAVLDDALKGKYKKVTQLIENNMEVVRETGKHIKEVSI